MEIKHTIEILTKDIQDIEKLVANLNNYTTPPQIELDLAMSKLRRVYELLSIISSDMKSDKEKMESEKPGTETVQANTSENDNMEKLVSEETTVPAPEPTISKPETVDTYSKTVQAETIQDEKTATVESNPNEKTETAVEKEIPKEPKTQKEGTILADKFETDKSLNEKIATGINPNVSSKIVEGHIDSIKRNIGINDRFQIIRELMNGDNEGFNQIIQKLDECTNFNEAFKHIELHFPDHLEHESVKILINLSRRKFISRENV